MATLTDNFYRGQLLERRQRLEAAIAEFEKTEHLVWLVQEIDSALERMDAGSYGLCEICHEPIEEDRLLGDPLLRNCLDHLTSDQRCALERDLDLTSRIQRRLLPRQNLSLNGWEVYYHYEPAGTVSGDYCDLVSPAAEAGALFFILGDVSGKGVAASMLVAHLHALFRSLIAVGLPVNELVERANRLFCESVMPGHFATLVCGRAGVSGEVEVSNAGHCSPLWVQGGEVRGLESTGLPLGAICGGQYSTKTIQLNTGDSLVLYTDGLSEARDRADAEYGAARLSRLLRNHYALTAKALIDICLEDLTAFLSGARRTDDLTIMVIRRAE